MINSLKDIIFENFISLECHDFEENKYVLIEKKLKICYGETSFNLKRYKKALKDLSSLKFILVDNFDSYEKKIEEINSLDVMGILVALKTNLFWKYMERDSHDRINCDSWPTIVSGCHDYAILDRLSYFLYSKKDDLKIHSELLITHDIDELVYFQNPKKVIKNIFGDFIYKDRFFFIFKRFFYILRYLYQKKDPFDQFSKLLICAKGYKQVFLFMVSGTSKFDNKYSITSEAAKNAINEINLENKDIGLHYSYSSAMHKKEILRERGILRDTITREPIFVRSHYLRFQSAWELNNDEFEGTVDLSPYISSTPGFIMGTSKPFNFKIFKDGKAINIKTLPTTFMDTSLVINQKRNEKYFFNKLKSLALEVRNYGGIFVLNWHNTSFDWAHWIGRTHYFEKTIRILKSFFA